MPSKIKILKIAQECGLNVPNTKILSNKTLLHDFFKSNNNEILTKSLGEGKHIEYNNENYPFFTFKIENLNSISKNFSPTLFQKYTDKIIEIRTFYLNGECYSMAIFSQNDKKTKVDFRNYDLENPTRYVPYKLPKDIEEKINNMMIKLNLNTGSLDIIYSPDRKYYFLEVNPAGQFGMTSDPCNYSLHRKVAKYLNENSN
ncbi:grasp-with-spasm system ATP-grasp peptide maturase [Confluentibacter sediminis]|uniref:grasp-with-spasm system ATP-grasp peptide maturase n=1 Tax=Confluentibacter sediminis TaxID=2219045 RepID=UPI0013A6C7CD|nr:grasp-with-spasm system ATP-grasp peptide maturase [Confluentibacter sediminis]